ncbi:DUF1176 domain-containing protein [Sphingomonas lenta]|uniref:DUF1176 domain-containing protein n=1 Tax=Sphingomonas lenta TaxID=1141887 RepID=A0A2A2SG18_9SPHN|nr:DUF1176 domain-containing protein [Sphingomonas lenta]PAX08155.1 hypothetical protein CKY28_11280 [Sphingomonas lenta]
MFLLALAAQAIQPQPGELKTFGDWTVGCDNARACRAVALVPDGEDRAEYLLLVIDREGAPNAPPVLSFTTERELAARDVTLRVDGERVGQLTGDPLPFNRALASALVNGERAAVTDLRGRTLASASLTGLAAAFLYMDERQRRLGTQGALRRTGPKPDAAVPAPPPLPRVVEPAPTTKPPRRLAPATAAKLIGPDNATCEYAQGRVEPQAFRLDATHSLALVTHPCGNGAYNIMTSVYVLDEQGRTSPARFDSVPGFEGGDGNVLVNGDWDPRTRRLSEFPKARGLGDCGTSSDYAWDGARFRLVRSAAMGECRGSIDYIVNWRAEVVPAR